MKLFTCLAAVILLSGCVADIGSLSEVGSAPPASSDGGGSAGDPWVPGEGGAPEEGGGGSLGAQPNPYAPCSDGACWQAPGVTATCGEVTISDDFSTGKYNVHERPVWVPAGVAVELRLDTTAGAWEPALLIADGDGVILHDGEVSSSDSTLQVEGISTGEGASSAVVRVLAEDATQLYLYATAWGVVDSGFSEPMPTDAAYQLHIDAACDPGDPGGLLSPPNFDPSNVVDGFFLLPQSDPPGLYTRKADGCSRGTKRLIDVLYTVATHWKVQRPALAPLNILDLNEGPCSTVDHATHEDGTHVDLVAGCATEVSCQDNAPAIELAKLFVDTGVVCGILNNDTAVQAEVNAYFGSMFAYEPWHGQFMRSVSGHTHHFHVRVMKPNGQCN